LMELKLSLTVRTIKIIRGDKVVTELDFVTYSFLFSLGSAGETNAFLVRGGRRGMQQRQDRGLEQPLGVSSATSSAHLFPGSLLASTTREQGGCCMVSRRQRRRAPQVSAVTRPRLPVGSSSLSKVRRPFDDLLLAARGATARTRGLQKEGHDSMPVAGKPEEHRLGCGSSPRAPPVDARVFGKEGGRAHHRSGEERRALQLSPSRAYQTPMASALIDGTGAASPIKQVCPRSRVAS
jgi:hypothetical protein